jgi:Tol biopolymer transport system component
MKKQSLFHSIFAVLLATMILLSGCQAPNPSVQEAIRTDLPKFTYSTSTGEIWQIDTDGNKRQLLPSDNVQKWYLSWSPDRHALAYVTREFTEIGTKATTPITSTSNITSMSTPVKTPIYMDNETLVVVDANGRNRKQLAGPARAIKYEWGRDSRIIGLGLTYELTDGSTPQQWNLYWVDTQNGVVSLAAPENWNTPEPTAQLNGNDQELFISMTQLAKKRIAEQQNDFAVRTPIWSPTREWILFELDTKTRINQPCLIHVPSGDLSCFDISSKSDQFVWSADGHYLAFLAPAGDGPIDIYAIDAGAGKLINLTQDGNNVIEDWIAP